MPLVKISIRKGRSPGEKKQLLDIVHSSLVDAFKLPRNDRIQRICEFDDESFEFPADRTNKFTIIEITILPGRSFEAKKTLYQLIFGKLKAIGYQDNDAAIVLTEPELNNWGVCGGYPASEINIGFNLNV
jgi:phenylpyruvate tautomerase PptA (4-oxalocrotonate tautomerase family)